MFSTKGSSGTHKGPSHHCDPLDGSTPAERIPRELSPRPIRAGPAHERHPASPGGRPPASVLGSPGNARGAWPKRGKILTTRRASRRRSALTAEASGKGSGSGLRGAGPPPPNCCPPSPLRGAVSHGFEALRPFCVLGQQVTVRRQHPTTLPNIPHQGASDTQPLVLGPEEAETLGWAGAPDYISQETPGTAHFRPCGTENGNLELPQRQIPG